MLTSVLITLLCLLDQATLTLGFYTLLCLVLRPPQEHADRWESMGTTFPSKIEHECKNSRQQHDIADKII